MTNNKPYFIAEIGINHNGDLQHASQMMTKASDAGFDAVKFQKRDIDLVYTQEYLNSPRESPWGHTQRKQKEALEFGREEYNKIDALAKELGIDWFGSPWDPNSLDFLLSYEPNFIKIPSALNHCEEFLNMVNNKIDGTKTKAILSLGMTDQEKAINAISVFNSKNLHCVMECVSTYPCHEDELNLALIKDIPGYVFTKLGLSCHCPTNGTVWAPLAWAFGAEVFEWHVTLDPYMYGSDQKASITFDESNNIIESVYTAKTMIGDKRQKEVLPSEVPVAKKLRDLAWLKK